MNLSYVNSENAPKAIGPYSHAVKSETMIITSGQIPLNPSTNEIVTDVKKATQQVLDNLLNVVIDSGGSKDTIARVDLFVKSLEYFDEINEVYTDFFGDRKPSRVLIEVSKLPAGAILEASVLAFRDDKER